MIAECRIPDHYWEVAYGHAVVMRSMCPVCHEPLVKREGYASSPGGPTIPGGTIGGVHWMAEKMGTVGCEGPEVFAPLSVDEVWSAPVTLTSIRYIIPRKPDTSTPQAKALHNAVQALRRG